VGVVIVLLAILILTYAWLAPASAADALEVQALAVEAPVVPIVFPLEKRFSWTDTFGAARSGGRTHEGNDIMVPKMTPLLAVVGGNLDWMNLTGNLSSYDGRPYYNILLRGDDGNDYFYIHMNNDTPGTDDGAGGVRYAYAPGLTNGTHVTAGQLVGWAGDSGNAEDAGSHLHFELHLGGYKNPVDPYASLMAAPLFGAGGGGDPGPGGQLDPGIPHFTDVGSGDWFFNDLSMVYALDIVKGYSDGSFRPYEQVSRAQFVAFMARAFLPEALDAPPPTVPTFTDIPSSFWGYSEVEAAAAAGFVLGTGRGGTAFSPDIPITRAQMAAILCRALGLDDQVAAASAGSATESPVFEDVPQGYWAIAQITAANVAGLVLGGTDGLYRPEESTKRAHAAAVIARALRLREADTGA
jgi:hypothetical protein